MIEIDDKIVSTDLLRECFACDLGACKGICCVEGNAGAPLETDEVDTLEEEYPNYKPYMTPEGIRAVEAQDLWSWTKTGTTPRRWWTTPNAPMPIRKRITFCAIEKAFRREKRLFANPSPAISIRSA